MNVTFFPDNVIPRMDDKCQMGNFTKQSYPDVVASIPMQ